MTTAKTWGGHGSLEKFVKAVSAGAIIEQLTPEELGKIAQALADAKTKAEVEKYKEAFVAGFYGL